MIVTNWFGIFAPARLPKQTLGRLHKAVIDAMNAPDVRTRFANLALDITAGSRRNSRRTLKASSRDGASRESGGNQGPNNPTSRGCRPSCMRYTRSISMKFLMHEKISV
jgi:hypothetical protein